MYDLLECLPTCKLTKSSQKCAQKIGQSPKCPLNCLPGVSALGQAFVDVRAGLVVEGEAPLAVAVERPGQVRAAAAGAAAVGVLAALVQVLASAAAALPLHSGV